MLAKFRNDLNDETKDFAVSIRCNVCVKAFDWILVWLEKEKEKRKKEETNYCDSFVIINNFTINGEEGRMILIYFN